MAEAGVSVSPEDFSCSICLDMLKDPVAIPCGHSFCMNCITGYWNHPDQRGVCTCPLCKYTFAQRPVLCRNTTLAEMLLKLSKMGFQPQPTAPSYAAPGDVPCDICTDQKLKAVFQCVICLVTYCETHAEPHQESPAFKHHPLIKVSEGQWKICEKYCCVVSPVMGHLVKHSLPCNIFCVDDQQCLCLRCLDSHKGHRTVSADEEMIRKQVCFALVQIANLIWPRCNFSYPKRK